MARSVFGRAPPPSRGTRRSFQNRFAESIFGTHPLSVGASAPPPVRDQEPGTSLPGPDAGHPLQGAGGHGMQLSYGITNGVPAACPIDRSTRSTYGHSRLVR
jgi:hypothetical protein